MHIGICDDNKEQLSIVVKHVKTAFEANGVNLDTLKINTYTDVLKMLYDHEKQIFTVIFLDVDMPIKGFHVAEDIKLINEDTLIIYVTSFDNFATHGYRYKAYRFIRKHNEEEYVIMIGDLIETIKKRNNGKLPVPNIDGVPLNKIRYLQSGHNYAVLHTTDGAVNAKSTLAQIEKTVDNSNFFRISRNTIVNFAYVSEADKIVTTTDNEQFKVSRSKIKELELAFVNYIRNKNRAEL